MPYYAIARGWCIGVYSSWQECLPKVHRYSGALYKRFNSRAGAWNFLADHLPQQVFDKIIMRDNIFFRNSDGCIEIYTDGACQGNGTPEAKTAIGLFFADNHPENVSKVVDRRTNIGAEIEAILEAISIIDSYQLNDVIIYTDCQFIVKGLNQWIHGWIKRGWRNINNQPVAYKREFKFFAAKKRRWSIQFEHVRGHSGIYGNEQADKFARRALQSVI